MDRAPINADEYRRTAATVDRARRELLAMEAHVAGGTLPDVDLHQLLASLEAGAWYGVPRPLDAALRAVCRGLAATAVHRQHGGRFVVGRLAWVSDGVSLKVVFA